MPNCDGGEGDTDASKDSSSLDDESDATEDDGEEAEDLELVADPSDADDPFADGMPAGGNNISAGTAIRLPVRRADAVMETADTFGIIWNRMPPIASL